jgi:death-on-curing protein
VIQFLTVAWIIWAHGEQLAEHGGTDGIRDRGALESAVATPQSSFDGQYLHATIWDMAAAYTFHIAQNQPFVDGNKRAALAAGLTFLKMNGVDVDDPAERLHDALIALAERRLDKGGLAALFRELATGQIG